jgi:hypothetical protein
MSNPLPLACSSACVPSGTVTTSWPSRSNERWSIARRSASSSTTRIFSALAIGGKG